MKASISRVCLGSLLMCVLTLSPVLTPKIHAAPFAKRFSFTQPSGIRIELWGQGDEFYAVFETLDGYTVVFEPTLKAYCYAHLTTDRGELVSTGVEAGERDPRELGLATHLRASAETVRRQVSERYAEWDAVVKASNRWNDLKAGMRRSELNPVLASPPVSETTGSKTGLCLLVDFSDEPATVPRGEIESFCNGENYTGYGNNGSVKAYFRDNSGGQLIYSNVVTAYVRLPKPKSYFNDLTLPMGDQGRLLVEAAIRAMKTRPDYVTSILPSLGSLTVKGGKQVVALAVFFAGGRGVWGWGLWPHRWVLSSPLELSPGGKTVSD